RTTVLYPALLAGLKQPDGMARMYMGDFIKNRLTLADVQAVAPALVAAAAERSPADRMFSDVIRYDALNALAKFKIEEAIPLCLMVKEQTWHGDDWLPFDLLANTYRGAATDALPTLYKWQAHLPQFDADGSIPDERYANIVSHITSTIAAIEGDTAPPTLASFKTLTATANPPVVTLPTTSTVLTPCGELANHRWVADRFGNTNAKNVAWSASSRQPKRRSSKRNSRQPSATFSAMSVAWASTGWGSPRE
ncbi:MAG: hypothetical protein WCI75_18740, partial [candidate division NC10 bacterium]